MSDIVLGKKVVIPISVLCGGGTEMQTLQLARTLISSNCRVEVICFNEYYQDVVDMFEHHGVNVTLLKEDCRKDKISFFFRILKLFRTRKPDVVHVQYTELGLLTLFASWLARVPTRLATVHQLSNDYGLPQKVLMKISLSLSSAFLFVSRSAERSWFGESNLWSANDKNGKKHFTIYNCIDITSIQEAKPSTELNHLLSKYNLTDDSVIGIVGRISRQKGHLVLLEALTLLKDELGNGKVLVIGDVLEKDLFETIAKERGLDKNIVYTGWLPANELYKLYHLMDITVIPSLRESFGLVAIEAMASGSVVIASNIEGLSEIIENGVNGVLIEPHDPKQLASAISAVLRDDNFSEKLRRSGTKMVHQLFGMEKYSEQILSFYAKFSGH